ncbi:MAG: hypothetical protein F6K19_32525, partial [Cyanothece sp. SIO1E1]|nr:hypothetical protein [Cyanothece sp. SIO1E1]
MKFSDLVKKLGAVESSLSHHPNRDPEIQGVAAVDAATPATLSYIEGGKFAAQVSTTAASASAGKIKALAA